MSLNRSFVFLKYPYPDVTQGSQNDYLSNPDAARKVVRNLQEMGVKHFLVIAGRWTIDEFQTIAPAITEAGLQFFSYEGWALEDFIDAADHIDLGRYRQERIDKLLLPLKKQFPDSFIGFHFKDEPGLAHLDALGELKGCLSSQSEFEGMKVFLNLLPIHANYAALSGLAPYLAGARPPSDFGIDCATNSIADHKLAKGLASGYGTYARRATEKIRPDYLCFDLYPFSGDLARCEAARELTVSENLSIVSLMGKLASITPVAYLQNVEMRHDFYANFHHLRWFASWAIAFGIRDFGNFVSHSGIIDNDGAHDMGLLDLQNDETKLGIDQRSVFGFLRHIQYGLATLHPNRFVAPFLGVITGDIVGWLPSQDVLAGEYSSSASNQVMVFFARRRVEGTVQVTVGLTASFTTIEQLDVPTGQWNLVGHSLNTIQVALQDFPGALYRLTG